MNKALSLKFKFQFNIGAAPRPKRCLPCGLVANSPPLTKAEVRVLLGPDGPLLCLVGAAGRERSQAKFPVAVEMCRVAGRLLVGGTDLNFFYRTHFFMDFTEVCFEMWPRSKQPASNESQGAGARPFDKTQVPI